MDRRPARVPGGAPRRGPGRRLLGAVGRALRLAVLLVVGYVALCLLALVAYRWVPPPVTGVQLQRTVEAALGEPELGFRRDYVGADALPAVLRHAVVAAEDTRFYQHAGIDWQELEKARREAERRGRNPRGASTITQQLVKNLFFTTHRNYARKALEFPLALWADWVLPKERQLTLYLNVVEWGPGVYGAEAAAQHHYGVPAARLSRDQAARLAACLPAPRTRTPQRMGGYAGIIQRRMRQMGW